VQRPGAYPLYDFTSSSITPACNVMGPDDPEHRKPLRVDGTLLMEHSFGIVRVNRPRNGRRVTLAGVAVSTRGALGADDRPGELSFPPAARQRKPGDPAP